MSLGQKDGTKKKAEEIVEQYIVDEIMSHNIKPGDRIYETQLAEQLGVSRTPVRHAISRLVSEGILEDPQREKGYIVPILTPLDMKHIYTMRELLESEAAFEAAQSISRKDITYLRELNFKEEQSFKNSDRKAYTAINKEIHCKIVDMSQNLYLKRFFRQIFWKSQLYTFYLSSFYSSSVDIFPLSSQKPLSYLEHARIIDAIASGDPERARQEMITHIRKSYKERFIDVAHFFKL
ncbi:MAG: GntR family transcriptional regulator [Aminobacterium sp.]|jgi:DNA-binding GntR family transcriptional regulator|uniref:GntR family transcriptional regulator n=1 Tax=unclassified Aminobacterium TaxID=2685012 RepID=UPI001BCFD00F|nr:MULTISPECIES: GntR family transcriptional regulator [unclassified Aminobacterium]MDD2207273.1 GntR family transcriptional regulator [Aminobacterium sp.]MDD3707764.1 GntR family transcriptional regulator [Aminobacterium sp.]MDD4229157.1 GntR family transcriptional regulator [Aminobacterium sp.]MDD4552022.1 GntR family transcriptional regulator [Aminobacterium sp.]MEA4877039.1 GntR family transcriptional regulator [Aminobacterium sp.]